MRLVTTIVQIRRGAAAQQTECGISEMDGEINMLLESAYIQRKRARK